MQPTPSKVGLVELREVNKDIFEDLRKARRISAHCHLSQIQASIIRVKEVEVAEQENDRAWESGKGRTQSVEHTPLLCGGKSAVDVDIRDAHHQGREPANNKMCPANINHNMLARIPGDNILIDKDGHPTPARSVLPDSEVTNRNEGKVGVLESLEILLDNMGLLEGDEGGTV